MNTYDIIAANKSFSGTDMVAMCHITAPDGTKDIYTLGSLQTLTYSIYMQRSPIRSIGNVNAKDYVLGPRTIAGSLIFAVFNKHFAYEAMESIKRKYNPRYAFLVDELPPFDITVSFANEYGAQSKLVLYGIRLVNEGQVMSVNDIYTENTYQFVATDIEYLTDVTGYSTYIDSSPKVQMIHSSTIASESTSGKNITTLMNGQVVDTTAYKVALSSSLVSPVFGIKKGIARISLNPEQSSGIITITGGSLSKPMKLNVSECPEQSIYVGLDAGKYTMVYKDSSTKKYSDEKPFTMTVLNIMVEQTDAPIIESYSDTKICIYSNVSDHTRVYYSIVDGSGDYDWEYVKLSGRRATIKELTPATKYLIFTSKGESTSSRIYADTKATSIVAYDDLKQYILKNDDRLKYGTLAGYLSVIEEAKIIAVDISDTSPVSTAISIYKNKIKKALKVLKASDFPTYNDYYAKIDELKAILDMSYDLINISNTLQNDNIIAINKNATAVPPPAPELADALNCVFLFGDNVEELQFYRQYDNVEQLAAEVHKVSFFSHSSGKYGFKFLGKPGMNHYVYALNKAGLRSPKLQFYVMTDEEREKSLNEYDEENDSVEAILAETEKIVGQEIAILNLSDNNENRLLIENAKSIELNVFPTPTIVEIEADKIIVDVSNNESMGIFDTEFYAVISDINDALYTRTVYKQLITNNTVEFTSLSDGVKPDKIYAIWIENSTGKQVSPCITVPTYSSPTDDLIAEEETIESYRIGKILTKVRYNLSNKISISSDVGIAINNLKGDTTVAYKNVFEKLAINLISYIPTFPNVTQLLRMTFESKMDIMYHIDEDFFDNISIANRTITFGARTEEYMISVLGVTTFSTVNTPYKVEASQEKVISYDKTYKYLVIFATSPDLYTKSGMIFIDTSTNTVTTYKIDI